MALMKLQDNLGKRNAHAGVQPQCLASFTKISQLHRSIAVSDWLFFRLTLYLD